MGAAISCTSSSSALFQSAADGDAQVARAVLAKHPTSAMAVTLVDRNSPIMMAASRGHYRLVQMILETAVAHDGPERAKVKCINHANKRGQSALMLACMNGHSQVVEYLVCNGASPLIVDHARHNTCLHWAASYCRSDCVQKLLGSSATYELQSGGTSPIADIPCIDDDDVSRVRLVDRHNGWGLTALHIAAFKCSISCLRALLRNSARIDCRTVPPRFSGSPVLCPVGSSVLHLAAQAGDVTMVRAILEAQLQRGGEVDLRRLTNDAGERPIDCVRSARNPTLLQLLDEATPISSTRQLLARSVWAQREVPPPHQILGLLLLRLKLVLSLELVSIKRQLAEPEEQPPQQPPSGRDAAAAAPAAGGTCMSSSVMAAKLKARALAGGAADVGTGTAGGDQAAAGGAASPDGIAHGATADGCLAAFLSRLERQQLHQRAQQLQGLLAVADETCTLLSRLCTPAAGGDGSTPLSASEDATELVLGTLITQRTVATMVQAIKMLVGSSQLTRSNASAALAAPADSGVGGDASAAGWRPGRRSRSATAAAAGDDGEYAVMLLRTSLQSSLACLRAGEQILSSSAAERVHASRGMVRQPSAAGISTVGRREMHSWNLPPTEDARMLSGTSLMLGLGVGAHAAMSSRRSRRSSRPRDGGSGSGSAAGSDNGGSSGRLSRREEGRRSSRSGAGGEERVGSSQRDNGGRSGSSSSGRPRTPPLALQVVTRSGRSSSGAPPLPRSRDVAPAAHIPDGAALLPTLPREPPAGSHTAAPQPAGALLSSNLVEELVLPVQPPAGEGAGPSSGAPFPGAGVLRLPHSGSATSLGSWCIQAAPGVEEEVVTPAAGAVAAAAAGLAQVPGGFSSSDGALSPSAAHEPELQVLAHSQGEEELAAAEAAGDLGGQGASDEEESAKAAALGEAAAARAGSKVEGGCLLEDDDDLDALTCAICMDSLIGIRVSNCSHGMCLRCAFQLCSKGRGTPLCPFCRQPISAFDAQELLGQ